MRLTATAEIELRPDGYLVARIREGVEQSLANANENLSAAIEECGGCRRPLLVDISRCRPLEPDVRRCYSGDRLVSAFLRLALLVDATPLGWMMGNIYLRIARPAIPTRLFLDEPKAMAWLGAHTS